MFLNLLTVTSSVCWGTLAYTLTYLYLLLSMLPCFYIGCTLPVCYVPSPSLLSSHRLSVNVQLPFLLPCPYVGIPYLYVNIPLPAPSSLKSCSYTAVALSICWCTVNHHCYYCCLLHLLLILMYHYCCNHIACNLMFFACLLMYLACMSMYLFTLRRSLYTYLWS